MKFHLVAKLASVAALAVSTVTVAGLGSAHASAVPHASKGSISILEGGSNDYSDGDVIRFVDVLQQEGYKVNVDVIEDSATALRAIVANKADFFIGDPSEVLLADANGHANIKLVAANDQSSNYEILAQKRYNLHNIKGATLGIAAPGTTTQVIVEAALKAEGINPQSVRYVDVGGTSARITALLAGSIDLAPALATSAIPVLATGKVRLLLNTGPVLGAYLQGGLIASDSYLKNNEATSQVVVNALIEAERWANTNEKGYIGEMNQAGLSGGLTGLQEKEAWTEEVKSAFHAINGGICPTYIAHSLKLDLETGSITKAQADEPTSAWLDSTFVQNFLKQNGQSATTC